MEKIDVQRLVAVNRQRLAVAKISRLSQADEAAREAIRYRGTYETAVAGTTIPWWVVAGLDYREESYSHARYLGNGQVLSRITTEVPAGRGPFATWQEGATDAMRVVKLSVVGHPLSEWRDWSLEGAATACELWNGPGYAEMGRASPYVWAGTTAYSGGFYPSDHHFSATAQDPRCGVVAIWRAMQLQGVNLGFEDGKDKAAPSTADPAVPSPPAPAGSAGHSAALMGGAGATILGVIHYLQTNGAHVMFDILCIVGAVALCYLGYYLYEKFALTVKADVSKVEAAVKPAPGPTGPTGATGA